MWWNQQKVLLQQPTTKLTIIKNMHLCLVPKSLSCLRFVFTLFHLTFLSFYMWLYVFMFSFIQFSEVFFLYFPQNHFEWNPKFVILPYCFFELWKNNVISLHYLPYRKIFKNLFDLIFFPGNLLLWFYYQKKFIYWITSRQYLRLS